MKKTERKLTGTYWKDTCHYYKFLNEETFLQVYYQKYSCEMPDIRIATSNYELFTGAECLITTATKKEFDDAAALVLDTIVKLL